MEKANLEKLIDFKRQIDKIQEQILEYIESKNFFQRLFANKDIELKKLIAEVYEVDKELAKLIKIPKSLNPLHVLSISRLGKLNDTVMCMSAFLSETIKSDPYRIKEIKRKRELIEKVLNDETLANDKESQLLKDKMLFTGSSQLLKEFLNQLHTHELIICDVDKALCLQDDIVFIGNYPEKDVTAFMRFLDENGLIEIDDNKIIESCFKRNTEKWNRNKLSSCRNKFKNSITNNHIQLILKKFQDNSHS